MLQSRHFTPGPKSFGGSLCSPLHFLLFIVFYPWQSYSLWPHLDGGVGPHSVWDISDVKH